MIWLLKTAACCATVYLVGFILEVWGGVNSTIFECKRDCKAEPDDYLCGRSYYREKGHANGKWLPRYQFLRNECERKCFMNGKFERVEMDHCTKAGHNYTTYRCETYRMRPSNFQKCMRNETMKY